MTGAGHTGRGHVVLAQLAKHGRAGETHEMRLQDQRDGDHHVEKPRPQNGNHDQGQQQRGEGQDEVHDAHQHRIDPAAGIAGHKADDDAGYQGNEDHDRADQQRVAGAMDETGQDIAPHRIGAEQEGRLSPFRP